MWTCQFENETSFVRCEYKDIGTQNYPFHVDPKESIPIASVNFSSKVYTSHIE